MILKPLSSLVLHMKNGTTTEQNQDGRGFPVTRIETIAEGVINAKRTRFVELDEDDVERWKLRNGDILLSHINSVEHIGKSAIYQGAPETLIHGMNLLLLRPNRDLVIPEYLHFGLRSRRIRDHIRARCKRAVNQASINQKELGAIELPIPSIDEQRRIVDLLSRAEGIVRMRREVQAKVQAIIPALFVDMFGDPATNPKGWPMSAIEDLCSVRTGATPLREQRLYYDGGTIPWVKTGEVCESSIVDVEEYITEKAVEETNCKVFPVNTILVAMYGQGQTRGRVGLLKVPAATNQACAAILPGEHINQNFLYALLMMQYERLRAMGRGGNQANLNLGMIKSFRVPCPPLGAQLYFEERRESVVSIAALQAEALKKAEDVFTSILACSFGN